MKELWGALKGHRSRFTALAIAETSVGGVEALLHPLLLKAIFDQAILARDFDKFLTLGAFYLLLGVSLNLGAYWISCWRKRFENSMVLALEMELLGRTLSMDGRQVTKTGKASYVSRVHNDVYEGLLPAIHLSIAVAKQALSSAVFVGVLLYLSWQASLILLVIIPPLIIISNRIAKKIQENTDPEREAEARYINVLTRTLDAFHALRGMSLLLPRTRAANQETLRGFLDLTYVNYRLGVKQRTLSDLIMNLSDTASMIIGAFFVFTGRMTFGGFLAFVNSLWRAATGIVGVINMIPQLRRSSAVLVRIRALRDSHTPSYHTPGPIVLVQGARVTYSEDVDIEIDYFELGAGEHILLRGPNGCGKTTLLHIISGTLAPDVGVVTLPPRVASLIAPVELPPLPLKEIVPDETLRISLGLEELADQLPSELSSGQRQRAGVAALLCEEADVYLLDEPFANLDEESRGKVLRALHERTRGRGLLIVHHGDMELDNQFDRVVTLSGISART